MTRYVVAGAAALILATAAITVQGYQQPTPDMAANRALAREQLAVIDEALAIQHALVRHGSLPFNDLSFAVWGRRKLETLRKTGAGKAEMAAALEKYVDSLKDDEAYAKKMHEEARATKADILDVRYRRMEAEIWLNEERAR